ncbi:MAG: GNAT family N-acetyltransferase [Alphaproteobacteria bacterium]
MQTTLAIKPAKIGDLTQILLVIADARQLLKTQDSGQWQDGTPSAETIKDDISHYCFYVLKEQNQIVGVMAVLDYEKDYDHLLRGKWTIEGPYFVIHRFAILSQTRGKGLATMMLKYVEKLAIDKHKYAIRIDTHEKNIPMINLLNKNGYQAIGIARLAGNKKRIAFEKAV